MPCWNRSEVLQHWCVNTIHYSFQWYSCRITRARNIAHPLNFGALFIYYSSTIFRFLDSSFWMVSNFIFHLCETCVIIKLTCVPWKPPIVTATLNINHNALKHNTGDLSPRSCWEDTKVLVAVYFIVIGVTVATQWRHYYFSLTVDFLWNLEVFFLNCLLYL